MNNKINLGMSARSLLRQAVCPECYHDGRWGGNTCTWCLERVQLMDNLLKSSQPNDTAIDILCEIYNASLFTEDDANGNPYTAVTDTPYIDEELFERLCNVISDKGINEEGKIVTPMQSDHLTCDERVRLMDIEQSHFFNIEEGTIKKNTNPPPTGPRPPPPKSQIAPQRDTAKEVALMALWAVRKEYGAKLHPNLLKDIEIAIEGLNGST